MTLTENSVKESFERVKYDIRKIQEQLLEISGKQIELINIFQDSRGKELNIEENIKKTKPSQNFVASKTGKSFHIDSCPFAKNIQPKHKITFKTKESALNNGYKACECVKR